MPSLKVAETESEGFISEQLMRRAFLFLGRQEQVKVCSAKLKRASLNTVRCSHIPLLLSSVKKSRLFLDELASPQIPTGIFLLSALILTPSQLLQGVCDIENPEIHFPSSTAILMAICVTHKLYSFMYTFMCVCVAAYAIQIFLSIKKYISNCYIACQT